MDSLTRHILLPLGAINDELPRRRSLLLTGCTNAAAFVNTASSTVDNMALLLLPVVKSVHQMLLLISSLYG